MSYAIKSSAESIKLDYQFGAHNYHPIPVVLSRGEGARVWDPEEREYLDFLSAYSAVNQGHCHPRLIAAAKKQIDRITLTSRAFHNDQFGVYAKFITEFFGYDMVLPMNTGVEGVETGIKLARKWGYQKKGIPESEAIVLACKGNFHGRTITAISMSSDLTCRDEFGPFLPNVGYKVNGIGNLLALFVLGPIRYNNVEDLRTALSSHGKVIAGFLVEPIQGEAGIVVPDDGYLAECYKLCKEHNVLFIADEVQTGLCRTGKMLACEYEAVKPDILILGKALSGGNVGEFISGMYPISAVLANKEIMLCIQPGQHGSTYGGNPLASALAIEALKILKDEKLADKSFRLGATFRAVLKDRRHPLITEVRGKGLLNAIVIDESKLPEGLTTWHICLLMKEAGLLAKPTHQNIIRFAPPLVITEAELNRGIDIILKSLDAIMTCSPLDFSEN